MLDPNKETIVVWFSCGAASAVAAKKTIEIWGGSFNIRVVNNPIKEEDSDNLRFLKDVEKWIGTTIEFANNSQYPTCSAVDVWDKKKYMSGIAGAPCTLELKKKARQQWEKVNTFHHVVLGFTKDEQKRHDRFIQTERQLLPVLIDLGLTKADCFKILADANIELPNIYKLGYPNANCIGCVKATSATYWNLVREKHPEVFSARAEQSLRIGAKLCTYKGERIQLTELPPDAKGRPLKNLHVECGIFCEEKF